MIVSMKPKIDSLTAKEVRARLIFDEVRGVLMWRNNQRYGRHAEGCEAGAVDSSGYKRFVFNGRRYLAHRVIWLHHYGEWPDGYIDHLNGVKTDNRISNLRSVTKSQNTLNSKLRSDNSSGVIGVHYRSECDLYVACIGINKQKICLGYYRSLEDAAAARKAAETRYGVITRRNINN